MAKQIERLAPLRGLNPTNVGEEAALQGTFMRGGYNVEVVDAEWWVRHGCGQASKNIGSIWWRWLISSPIAEKCFLVSNNYVVQINQQVAEPGVPDALGAPIAPPDPPQFFADLAIPYLHNHTMDVTFTYGSVSAVVNSVSGGTQSVGQIFQIEGVSGIPDQIYRIVAIPNAGLRTLDRPFERFTAGTAPTGNLGTVKVYDPCMRQRQNA